MARDQLHDSAALNFWFMSGQFGTARLEEGTLYTLDSDSHISQYVDAASPGTAVRLPPLSEGKFFIITNTGSEDLDIQSSAGGSLFTLTPGNSNLYHTEGVAWRELVEGGTTIGVFGPEGPGASDGLVPSPGPAQVELRVLGSDGVWHLITGAVIADGYTHFTDGTNTTDASGADTFRLRSSSGKITAVVTNNEAVFGDNANLSVNEAAVDHDALLNFVANEHIDHSGVNLTAGNGLAGGGTIAANRTFDLDLNDLPVAAAIVLTDTFGFYDISATATVKATFTDLNAILDHDSLLNFVANEHIDHSAVSISTGTGLTGGGDITASRTINLDFSALPVQAEAMASGDTFPFFDLSGGIHKKVSWNTINTSLDHDALTNFVGNEHIDHTAVTLTAGAGLTGGGDISASRSFAVGAGTGITVNADDVAISTDGVTNTLLANMAAWTIKLRNAGTLGDPSDAALADITAEGSPLAGMFLLGWLSTGEIRKFDIGDMPSTGGGGGTMDDFTVDADSGTPEVIADGNTLMIAGGVGIDTVVSATDTITVDLDAASQASLALADSAIQNFADLGITADAAELNILDGATLSTAELNFVDGVTSAIQTQLDGKQSLDGDLTSWAAVVRAAGFDTFAVTPTLANFGSLLTDEAAGLITFMTTPSSANLRGLLTDESGTGLAYFQGGDAGTPSALVLTNASGLVSGGVAAATLVTAADTIAANDNDTTWPTTAAIIDYSQPLDGDLTAIAALTTTAFGRSLLELADETALEALPDTLPNLTSIQGRTITLADAGVNAFFGWDDVAGAYENLTAAEAEAIIEPLIDTLANLTSIQGVSFTFGAYAATLLNNANEAAFKAAVNLEANTDFYAPGGTAVAVADGGTGSSTAAAARTALDVEQLGVRRGLNRQTVNYTFVAADAGKLVEMNNAADRTFTIPLNAAVPYATGTWIDIARYGAGEVAVVNGGGITVRSSGGKLRLNTQYSGGTLVKIDTDEWYLFGDIKT